MNGRSVGQSILTVESVFLGSGIEAPWSLETETEAADGMLWLDIDMEAVDRLESNRDDEEWKEDGKRPGSKGKLLERKDEGEDSKGREKGTWGDGDIESAARRAELSS